MKIIYVVLMYASYGDIQHWDNEELIKTECYDIYDLNNK